MPGKSVSIEKKFLQVLYLLNIFLFHVFCVFLKNLLGVLIMFHNAGGQFCFRFFLVLYIYKEEIFTKSVYSFGGKGGGLQHVLFTPCLCSFPKTCQPQNTRGVHPSCGTNRKGNKTPISPPRCLLIMWAVPLFIYTFCTD